MDAPPDILAAGPLVSTGNNTARRVVIRQQREQFVVHDQYVTEGSKIGFGNGDYFVYQATVNSRFAPNNREQAFAKALKVFIERFNRDMAEPMASPEQYASVMIPAAYKPEAASPAGGEEV